MNHTDPQLLEVIEALRRRLEIAQAKLDGGGRLGRSSLDAAELRDLAKEGWREQEILETLLRRVKKPQNDDPAIPKHLTHRSLELLQSARRLLKSLRKLADVAPFANESDTLATTYYQDTVLLTQLTLQVFQTMPEPAEEQMRLASGLDVLLAEVERRTGLLQALADCAAQDEALLDRLQRQLRALRDGKLQAWNEVFALADEVASECESGKPLRIVAVSAEDRDRFIAAHCLNTARVLARAAYLDSEWRARLLQPVTAALVHDAGMLAVPAELVAHPGSLNDERMEIVEKHCQLGARWAARVEPELRWLVEAIRNHHEQPSGLGYPAGLIGKHIDPLVQLLAACDTYAALRCPRPYRGALDSHDAMLEVKRLANARVLAADAVRILERLTPWPVGTAVELEGGERGVVVAVVPAPSDSSQPTHVVRIVCDGQGKPIGRPCYVNAGGDSAHSIKGVLPASLCRGMLAEPWPYWH